MFRSTLNSRASSNPTYANSYSAAYTPSPASAGLEPSSQEALGPAGGSGPSCRVQTGMGSTWAEGKGDPSRAPAYRVPGKEEPPKTTLRSPHPPAARRPPRDPMDCSLPGSSIHGICQARILGWVAIAFSASLSAFSLSDDDRKHKPIYKMKWSVSCSVISESLRFHEL